MGGGSWTHETITSYAAARKLSMKADGKLDLDGKNVQEIYSSSRIQEALRISGDMKRECRDTEEHPATIPVILALDVTGSMGSAAKEVASALNRIMTELYKDVKDVEFMIMALGDLVYDLAPIQVSQFESDIRIAEQLEKVFFEGGGGGNNWESYTAAWYIALHNTDLDCWKRGKKGLVITIGDEQLNPYLPKRELANDMELSGLQSDIETTTLRKEIDDKFAVAHIHVTHDSGSRSRQKDTEESCKTYNVPLSVCNVNNISDCIIDIVKAHASESGVSNAAVPPAAASGDISW